MRILTLHEVPPVDRMKRIKRLCVKTNRCLRLDLTNLERDSPKPLRLLEIKPVVSVLAADQVTVERPEGTHFFKNRYRTAASIHETRYPE
jgi:hypothetical protein